MVEYTRRQIGVMLLVLLALNAAAFIAYHLLGGKFNGNPIYHFWQYLDIELLRTDLFTSLWYQHSQPPLMNIIAGVAVKLLPDHPEWVLQFIYYMTAAAGIYWMFLAMLQLGIRLWLAWVVTAAATLFPTFFLYANWAYSPHLEFCFSAGLAYYLVRLINAPSPTFRDSVLLGIMCLILSGMRAQWHLVLWLVLFVYLWICIRPARKIFWLGILVTMIPLLGIYAKNAILFGQFTTSSWLGHNLAPVALASIPYEKLMVLKGRDLVAKDFPIPIESQTYVPPDLSIPHPALRFTRTSGQFNHNYIGILYSSKENFRSALALIKHYPKEYGIFVLHRIWYSSQWPAFWYGCCGFHYKNIPKIEPLFTVLLQQSTLTKYSQMTLNIAIPLTLLVWAIISIFVRPVMSPFRRHWIIAAFGVMFFMLLTGSALNMGEQERIRWGVAPFYFIFAALMANQLLQGVRWIKSRWALRWLKKLR